MKKVLIISYYWPPAGGPGVQRVLRFVKHLPEAGWQPIILTVENGDYPAVDQSLAEQIPAYCRVYTSRLWEPYQLFRKFTGRKQQEALPTYILNKQENESLTTRIARWVRANLFIPDARIGWLHSGVRAGRSIIAKEQPLLIFSTSPPHTVQLIARRLARQTGLPWVADFRDPWTEAFWAADIPQTALARRIDQHLERSVLQQADAVAAVSEGIANLLRGKADNDYRVIQNGLEPLELHPAPTEKFRILFIGHLSRHQNPETLFKAVEQLPDELREQIEIVFVGRVFEGFGELFDRYAHLPIQRRAYMPHRELMIFGQEAALLFRPIAQSSYSRESVGAKTYDYLALRKPTLTLGKKESISEKILSETRSGELFDYGDADGCANFIQSWFSKWEKNHYLILDNEKQLAPYTSRYQVGKLAELFRTLVNKKCR